MAGGDDRRRRGSGGGRSGQPGRGRPKRPRGQERQPAAPPGRRPTPSHTLRLEVGGHGIELHCDTCDLIVTHLAAPQVRRAVEEAHRRHLGGLTWESAWVAVCSCGWHTGRLSQQVARDELTAHEASFLRPAARGEAGPP